MAERAPGTHVETLEDVKRYTPSQIARAHKIARTLHRGKLVLIEPPKAA